MIHAPVPAGAAVKTLARSFGRYDDLVATIPASALSQRLPGLRSNTIGGQLWCVVGARESYAAAFVRGAWSGFDCSLPAAETAVAASVIAALRDSARVATAALSGDDAWTPPRQQLVLDLIEHEAAHQGQLIRYLYGLSLPIPPSWRERFALTP